MRYVLLTLIVGFTCQQLASVNTITSYLSSESYIAYRVYCALVYVLGSSCMMIIAIKQLNKNNNFVCFLMCTLCACMAVSAIFNSLMINYEIYNALIPFKNAWKEWYLSIEILISLIVGGNGLNYLAHVDICPHGKRNAIIRHNVNSNQGKQQ